MSAILALAIVLLAIGVLILGVLGWLIWGVLQVRRAEHTTRAEHLAHANYWDSAVPSGAERRLAILKDAAQQAEEGPLPRAEGGGGTP